MQFERQLIMKSKLKRNGAGGGRAIAIDFNTERRRIIESDLRF